MSSDNEKKVEQLKALQAKDLPKEVKKSIDKKLEYVNKPIHKNG